MKLILLFTKKKSMTLKSKWFKCLKFLNRKLLINKTNNLYNSKNKI